MEQLNNKAFFSNKENFIYYRNLFIRFIKTNDLYNQLINKLKTLNKLDEKLEEKIPEHYYDIVDDVIGFDFYERQTKVVKYLEMLTTYAMPKHRKKAISMAYEVIDNYNVNLDGLNNFIKNERKNCKFRSFEDTLFDDKNITCFDRITKYTPISLMFFYIGGAREGVPIREYKSLYEHWMHHTSKIIYNE